MAKVLYDSQSIYIRLKCNMAVVKSIYTYIWLRYNMVVMSIYIYTYIYGWALKFNTTPSLPHIHIYIAKVLW